jgi:NADH dehydrogenase
MILVTGGTGFIGQALIRHLVEERRSVRTLIRPSSKSPDLPPGVPIKAAISSITDERNLRAALVGVDTVFHLVGGEWLGARADLHEIEIEGVRNLVRTAKDAGVQRIFYLSHLGADRASAYPVLQAKGIAEQHIRRSGIDYTILRSALIFGPRDHFTTAIARLLRFFPFYFPLPGSGDSLVQPIWIEDLVTCLIWSLDKQDSRNQIYEIGGPEYLSINQVVQEIMSVIGLKRRMLPVRPSYMRIANLFLEYFLPHLPISAHWLDYFAMNRTCAIDSIPRQFGLLPVHFSHHLDYLSGGGRSSLSSPGKSRAV